MGSRKAVSTDDECSRSVSPPLPKPEKIIPQVSDADKENHYRLPGIGRDIVTHLDGGCEYESSSALERIRGDFSIISVQVERRDFLEPVERGAVALGGRRPGEPEDENDCGNGR